MRKSLPLLLMLVLPLLAMAQAVTVPRNVYFADIHLTITDRGQQEIQKKVDALHRSPAYFKLKVDLANAYFPLIERTFREEAVPDDFKYLALQESGLKGDAVSTSNAVGYWQFKKEAASDFNLRIDNVVDERSHIIEASRGAAKYFKRSNNYYDNWLITLLSYLEGYTGAKAYAKPSDKGAKKMEITDKTHPYVLTFLAHKIAYENFVGKTSTPVLSLREMRATPGQSLADIALATQTDPAELERYNKWLRGSSIPSDKDYFVMVPVRNGSDLGLLASAETASPAEAQPATAAASKATARAAMVQRNGLSALVARKGDTKDKLALQAGISTRKFLKYNDLRNFDKLEEGTPYYTQAKRNKADEEYHVVQPGETMQEISQHYGMKLRYLLFKNRMARNEVPVPGRVLWLQKRRPHSTPVEVRDLKQTQPKATPAPATTAKASTATAQTQPGGTKQDNNIFSKLKKDLNLEKPQPEQETAVTERATSLPEAAASKPAGARTTPGTSQAPATVQVTKTAPVQAAEPELVLLPETTAVPAQPDTLQSAGQVKNAALLPAKTQDTTSVFKEAPQEVSAATEEQTAYPTTFPTKAKVEESEEFLGYEAQPAVTTPEAPAKPAAPVKEPVKETVVPISQDQPAAKPARHTVKQGETLYSISRLYAVSVHDISKWNNLGEEPLKIGQEILIAEPQTMPEAEPATEEAPVTAPAAANPGYHTVAAGETLYQISKKYGLSVEELRTWNGLADNTLSLGQELRIVAPAAARPEAAPAKAEPKANSNGSAQTYHTVGTGESMYQISRKYGVTIKDIMEWNNKSDFNVKPGEKLLIKRR